MKLISKQVSIALLLTISLLGNISAQQINFEPGDTLNWPRVMANVKTLNRLIFVEVYSQNSAISKLMEKKTLTDLPLVEHLNIAFVNVRINIDSADGIAFAKKYKINCVPSYLFLDRDGNTLLQRGAGFYSIKDFTAMVESVRDPNVNTFFAYERDFNTDHPTAAVALTYLKALSESCMPANNAAVKFLTSRRDTADNLLPDHWRIIKDYVTDVESVPFKYLVNNRKSFIAKYGVDTVDAKIFEAYLNRGKELVYREKADKNKFAAYKTGVVNIAFDRNKELGLMLDWEYANASANWKDYYNVSRELVKKYKQNDAVFLNTASRKLFENGPEKKRLADLLQWAKKSTEIKPGWENLDTYAKLLFKTGDKAHAIETETKAIELAKAAELDTTQLTATLNSFNQGK